VKTPSALAAFAVMSLLAAPMAAHAERQWIAPTATVLSGADGWVTIDAAVSDDLFQPEHRAMPLDNITVTGPDGAKVEQLVPTTSHYRSSFDLHLTARGTYKVAAVTQGLMARYKLGDEQKMWRGKPGETTPAVPAGATDVSITQMASRIETFVTLGAPNDTALKTTGAGLELQPISHPNDLLSGEPARFKLLLDGKPAAGMAVTLVPGGSRYGLPTDAVTVKTGADGGFTVTFPRPDLWWLNVVLRDDKGPAAGVGRNYSYTAVLEVLRP
jgi:uncharacterized GH25 family protein